jgi:predicted CxxxxCH...CXXCH cytochrome family protein
MTTLARRLSEALALAIAAALALALAVVAAGCNYGSVSPGAGGGDPGGGDTGDGGDDGAGGGGDGAGGERYHPEGFADPAAHGPELLAQRQDCRTCHGEDLTGGTGPSCDGCHTPDEPKAWRTDCTFCHGGGDNQTGAPPRNLDGSDGGGTFPAHTAHVTDGVAAAADCLQCHVKATDVLSPGHVFDDTPAAVEVDLGAGISPQAAYDGETCTNTYCHGTGRGDDGQVAASDGALGCTGCHAGTQSGQSALEAMSGAHELHVSADGVTCGECHAGVTADGASIADRTLHINGARDVAFTAPGFTMSASQSCNGTCHGVNHAGLTWVGSGARFHPAGYAAASAHGPDMELQRMDCRSCHGSDLTGGSGPSCDTCHTPQWRTTCTYCHGGGQNQTGAPPRDLGSSGGSAQSFVAHTRHVTQGAARAFDCNQCHMMPADVLSSGHAFDASAGAAEVRMSGGLSPSGAYDRSGTCTNLYCHGNGRGQNGSATDGAGSLGCTGCHPGAQSGESAWQSMSGEHRKHLGEGMSCQECHSSVTSDGRTIRAPTLHVDGQRQIVFSAGGMSYDPGSKRCSGSCHGEGHSGESW